MASLAGLFLEAGYAVTGSDTQAYPPMSTMLSELGIDVTIGFSPDNLTPTPDIVIVGNVCTPQNPEARAAIDRGLRYYSMADAVAEFFCKDHHTFVVTGTHGKTTTTSMLSWLLEHSGDQPGFLIGGMPGNFEHSYRRGVQKSFVVEGDEYDTAFFDKTPKFLHYPANTLCIGSVEFDHADIYNSLDDILEAFRTLIAQQAHNGSIIADIDNVNTRTLVQSAPCPVIRMSTEQHTDANAQVVVQAMNAQGTTFEVTYAEHTQSFTMPMVGMHNVRNASIAILAAWNYGIAPQTLASALPHFLGIKRRQEIVGTVNNITVIDDFAHHPTAIGETLTALRARYPEQRFLVGFDPRSNTSGRNIFHAAYLDALTEAAHVYFAPVHKTDRIPEAERLNLPQLVQDLQSRDIFANHCANYDKLVHAISSEARPHDVVILMSNGDFGNAHRRILQQLEENA